MSESQQSSSGWNRSFAPFHTGANGTSSALTSNWRGNGNSNTNTNNTNTLPSNNTNTQSRWGQQTQSTSNPSSDSGSHSTAWRSSRVDQLKSDSNPNSNHSTPKFTSQQAPTQTLKHTNAPANEIVYQPSDFGNYGLQPDQRIKWYYLDPQRETQGPFASEDMRVWYENSYFDLKLPVQCVLDGLNPKDNPMTKWIPLGVWFLHGNKAFLHSLPDIVEQGRKSGVGVSTVAKDSSNQQSELASLSGDEKPIAAVSSSISSGVLSSDRNALSPVDDSYAASVSQLVADDDENLNDVTELERYNSHSQAAAANAQQQGGQNAGLNPTAREWNQRGGSGVPPNAAQQGANWQQRPAQPGSVARPSVPSATPAVQPGSSAVQSQSPSSIGQPQQQQPAPLSLLAQQQRLALTQQLQALPMLNQQYTQLQPLSIAQFLQGLNLTQQQVQGLSQQQMQSLQQQFHQTNQSRQLQQQQVQRQIQNIIMQQQQFTQQQHQQQQVQQPQSLLLQQQQYMLMQQQKQQGLGGLSQQVGQQQRFPAAGGVDAFGRPIQSQMYQQQQRSSSPFSQQQQQQLGQDAYGNPIGPYGQQPYGGVLQDANKGWSGQQQQQQGFGGYPQNDQLRDRFGNLALGGQQGQLYDPQQQQPYLSHQQHTAVQSPSDMNQTIVYTPNQVQHASVAVDQPQTVAPSQQYNEQQQPEPSDHVQQEEQQESEEYAQEEQPTEEDNQDQQEQEEQPTEEEQQEDAAPSSTTAAPSSTGPSVAPWAAPKAAASETSPAKPVKSLKEIQQEEERAQQHKNKQLQERQAIAARRQPFNTTWGGQANGLSLTPDEVSTAQVIHLQPVGSSALLPTPPSTTPSIRELTPILSTTATKQPRVPQGKLSKNGRRTEAAIAQMDQPAEAVSAASSNSPTSTTNAWGKPAGATTGASTPVAPKEPAPVVNAWATKRTPAGGASALLPSPTGTSPALSPQNTITVLTPPLLTIRPKSMQHLESSTTSGTGAPVTRPLNTVRILETQILEMPPAGSRGGDRKIGGSRGPASSSRSSTVPLGASKRSSGASSSAAEGETTAFGGPTMSSDFESWCKEHLTKIAGADGYDVSLPQFLMTVQSDDEVKDYLHTYLGTGAKIDEFADEFLKLKAFETENQAAAQKGRKK